MTQFDAGALVFRIQSIGKAVLQGDLRDIDAAATKTEQTLSKTAKTTDQNSTAQDQLGKSTRETSKQTREASKSHDDNTKSQEQNRTATQSLKTELLNMSSEGKAAVNEVGVAMVGVGATILATTALNVKAAMEWESAWAGVTKTVEGTPQELKAVEDGLRDMTGELPASHAELAAVAEAAGQLGVKTKDILSFTKTMVQLGETTNLSSEEAATSLAQFMNIMQSVPEDVDRVGATVVALGNAGASTEAEIVSMAQRIAGSGKLVGATEGEVLGLSNALASMGVTAELGGGVASRVLQDMYSAIQSGGEQAQGFAKVAGLSASEFAEAFGNDPIRALGLFATGLNDVEASGGNVITTLIDLGFRSTEEQRILLQLKGAGDLLTSSLDLQAQAWEENTALQDEAAKRFETTESQLQILQNRFNEVAIDLGATFLPAVNAAAFTLGGAADVVASMPPELQAASAGFAAIVGTAGLAGGALLLAVPKAVEFRQSLQSIRTEMPRLAGAGRNVAMFLGGPWGIALGVATGMLGGFIARQSEAAARVDALVQSLDQQTGALTDNSRALVAKELAQDADIWDRVFGSTGRVGSIYDRAEKIGLSLDIVTDAALGSAAAMDLVREAVEKNPNDQGAQSLIKSIEEVKAETEDAREKQHQLNEARGVGVEAGNELAEAESRVAEAAKSTAGALTETTEAQQEWIDEVAAANGTFVSLTDGINTVTEANKKHAQETADATENAKDSWEDYYDGFSFNLADFLEELQRQVDAQSEWEANMVRLAGRVSSETLKELGKLGPEGAPLVAALVDGSAEQLAQFEVNFAESAVGATTAFSSNLISAETVIRAAAAQLGEGTANEIRDKLAAGTATVAQIMQEYKLEVENIKPVVNIDTATATERIMWLRGQIADINGKTAAPGPWNNFGQGFADSPGRVTTQADGGRMGAPQVYAYADGAGSREAQFRKAGSYVLWAEDETSPGEYFIPMAPSKRARSLELWEQAGRELGALPDVAEAGTGSVAPGVAAPATAGMNGPLIGSLTIQSSGNTSSDLQTVRDELRILGLGGRGRRRT